MPQVFQPQHVLSIKVVLLGVLAAAGIFWVALYQALPEAGGLRSPQQPIAFSHKHHAGDDGIDCRYCHYSVEKSAFAGIPSSEVCLTCHSQLFKDAPILQALRDSAATGRPLAWVRVHDLPDFVFFNHSVHIAKGIDCGECHGQVDRMPQIRRVASLEMQWCLECHRRVSRERHLDERRMTDCSTCHR
jgi:hypothetical protein